MLYKAYMANKLLTVSGIKVMIGFITTVLNTSFKNLKSSFPKGIEIYFTYLVQVSYYLNLYFMCLLVILGPLGLNFEAFRMFWYGLFYATDYTRNPEYYSNKYFKAGSKFYVNNALNVLPGFGETPCSAFLKVLMGKKELN